MRPNAERPLTGKKVLLLFALFMGVVAGVNAVFIYHALDSFPGVVEGYRPGVGHKHQ